MDIRESLNILNESTGLECRFVETAPGVWYSLLEDDFIKNGWDWREDARCFGPFKSEEQAAAHLRANFANPGGSYTDHFDGNEPDDTMKKLMGEAPMYMKAFPRMGEEDGGDDHHPNPYKSFNRWGR